MSEIKVVINDITRLSAKIAELEAEITQLNTQITDLETQIQNKDIVIETLTRSISELESQISTLQGQVVELSAQVDTLTTQNQFLTQQIQTLNEQISSLTTQISNLNTQITNMNSAIETINGETVANPIAYLSETKSQILTALQNKGSSATSSTTFRNYVTEITQLNPAGDLHTKLLLRFSNPDSYGDVSMFNVPVTFSTNFTRSSSIKKFGDYSAEVSNNSYLTIYRRDMPSWRYTFEFWIYMTSYFTSVDQGLASESSSLYSSWTVKNPMFYTTNNIYEINFYTGVYNNIIQRSSVSLDTWHHVAYTRNENRWYTFLDGVKITNGSADPCPPLLWTGTYFRIGGTMGGVTAYIDEFRISDICRYTEDFTPPTAPF